MYATTLTHTDRTDASTTTCPDCGSSTVSAQGLLTCGTCRWYDAGDR
jgi:ribosomal protein L37AE/L43A